MKLKFKLILTTVLIVAMSVSLCTTVFLSSSFQSELRAQYESAMQESGIFCAAMGSMASQTMAASLMVGAREAVEQFLESGVRLRSYAYQVTDGEGIMLAQAKGFTPALKVDEDTLGTVSTQVSVQNGRYILETLQQLQVADQIFTVRLFRDITSIFETRDQNLRLSYLAILGALAVGSAVIVVVSMFFVAPIDRLARTTRLMAQGQYSRRALVTTHDELGALEAREAGEHTRQLARRDLCRASGRLHELGQANARHVHVFLPSSRSPTHGRPRERGPRGRAESTFLLPAGRRPRAASSRPRRGGSRTRRASARCA